MRFKPLTHTPYVPARYEAAFQRAAEDEEQFAQIEQVYGRAA